MKDDAVGVGPALLCACADYLGSLCIVKECVELEEMLGCAFVQKLKVIMQKDHNISVQKCTEKATLIAEAADISWWPRIWDGCKPSL